MKILILTFFAIGSLFAINPKILPLKGVDVIHTYSNGEKEKIKIERKEDPVCMNYGITPENFQSGNLASKEVPEVCKKTFFVTRGAIQPFKIDDEIETYGELEVLEFIEEKSNKNPEKFILVDSRKKTWFDYGTIPSAVNIPYDEFDYDEDFEDEFQRAFNLLGVKILKKDEYDFSKAKTVVFFCNGAWCGQSPMVMKKLIKIGYPKNKMKWYRGGIAAWVGVSMNLSKNIEVKK